MNSYVLRSISLMSYFMLPTTLLCQILDEEKGGLLVTDCSYVLSLGIKWLNHHEMSSVLC